jgi:hypothetical protein
MRSPGSLDDCFDIDIGLGDDRMAAAGFANCRRSALSGFGVIRRR